MANERTRGVNRRAVRVRNVEVAESDVPDLGHVQRYSFGRAQNRRTALACELPSDHELRLLTLRCVRGQQQEHPRRRRTTFVQCATVWMLPLAQPGAEQN